MEQVLVVNRQALEAKLGGQVWVTAVSYTHLTLPTTERV